MKEKFYGSLHNHTDFSNRNFRDSTNTVESLISRAVELGQEVLAITEHDFLGSAIRAEKFYEKIKKTNPNFKLILGNEIYLCRNGLNSSNFQKGVDKYFHFILLAKNAEGHKQIRQLSTRAWLRSYVQNKIARVPTYYQDLIEIIGQNKGNVIGSTACLGGVLPTKLLKYKETQDQTLYNQILNWCRQMNMLFGEGNFYLEMQPSSNEEQIYVNKELLKISKQLNIPYIITTDSHYLKKEDRPIHKAFLQSQNGDREVDEFYSTTYLMNTDEIIKYFSYFSEEDLSTAFLNIKKIKNLCEDYSLRKPLKIPRLNWKTPNLATINYDKWFKLIPNLYTFHNSPYEEDKRLADIIIEKISCTDTLWNDETYNETNLCLSDIWVSSEANNARWSAYLLNLQNIIDCCWDAGSLVGAGRGSGVGFLLLYLLGITQINPLWEKTQTYRFRFLNPKRVSPLDIDVDIESTKRAAVMNKFREIYSDMRVANVLTLRTEAPKSAILTAARGLGIDIDIAQYLASMVESDRGIPRTLKQTFYGDEEAGFGPNKNFQFEMEQNYPELWEVAQYIEGLICGIGIHAGGVIFVDEDFPETCALMKAPNGEIITQYDLHDAEEASLIKYDILSINSLDKIHICLDLLEKDGRIEKCSSLREEYEKTVGIYNIERNDKGMWKMVWDHDILSLFQMEEQSGIQGIEILKPQSVDELSILNSTIRLMAQQKGGEMPTEKLARFKRIPEDWDRELATYGLGRKEKEILLPILGISYGLCITQEQFMMLVQLPELGGFPLEFADKLRKSIAKKNPAEYEKVTEQFFAQTKEKGCNPKLCEYVWNVLIAMSRGYGFNASHTLAYSLIALQEMNLAYKYPIIYWNCACLISNVTSENEVGEEEDVEIENETEDEEPEIKEVKTENGYVIEEFVDEDDEEENDEPATKEEKKAGVKKKVSKKGTRYGKIATAIGKMEKAGVKISLPDINSSELTFTPDVDNNVIRYGLSGISRVSVHLIKSIIENRPYTSISDFLSKIKVTKPQMINLIKAGAFDSFGDRVEIMRGYITTLSKPKTTLNLRNMQMLMKMGLLPVTLEFECKTFNFNKYLKQFKVDNYYQVNEIAFKFYEAHFDIDNLFQKNNEWFIVQKTWDKIYSKTMDAVRAYISDNLDDLLKKVNKSLFDEIWEKDCKGNISKWEMDAISCYFHEHELAHVNKERYDCSNFFDLPETPIVEKVIQLKGQQIPIIKIHRIMGTVLDKNKTKKTVTLLTTDGVVTVKIYGQVFTHFDKQISEKGPDGKKHVIEKSTFSRGNKIIVAGIRRGESFVAKKYKYTPYELLSLITDVKGDSIALYTRE